MLYFPHFRCFLYIFRRPRPQCIELMHGRFFDNRRLECALWDGKTNYKVAPAASSSSSSSSAGSSGAGASGGDGVEAEDEDAAAKRDAEFGDWLDKHPSGSE